MADDGFTAELEWLLRLRREAGAIARVLRQARQYHMLAYSSQKARDIRRWVSEENLVLDEDLERIGKVLDPSWAKFLEEPTVRTAFNGFNRSPALPCPPSAPPDLRPIKGAGRRHGFVRKSTRRETPPPQPEAKCDTGR